jgi:hypothetical protein
MNSSPLLGELLYAVCPEALATLVVGEARLPTRPSPSDTPLAQRAYAARPTGCSARDPDRCANSYGRPDTQRSCAVYLGASTRRSARQGLGSKEES